MVSIPKKINSSVESTDRNPESNRYGFEVIDAIVQEELTLSISPLLGCDYVFIHHNGMHELLSHRRLGNTLQELFEIIELQPRQSAAIAADIANAKITFTRYDYTWEDNRISRVSATKVVQDEQIEFLQMMFNCSSIIDASSIPRNDV